MNYNLKTITFEEFEKCILVDDYNFHECRFNDIIYGDYSEEKPDLLHFGDLIEIIMKKNDLKNEKTIELSFNNCHFEIDAGFNFKNLPNVKIKRVLNSKFYKSCYIANTELNLDYKEKGYTQKYYNAVFTNVSFRNIGFENVIFNTDQIFLDSSIDDNAAFDECCFKKDVVLVGNVFNGNIIIQGCDFLGNCICSNNFKKNVLIKELLKPENKMKRTKFDGILTLNGGIEGRLLMSKVILNEAFNFYPSMIGNQNVIFDSLEINKYAKFSSIIIPNSVLFSNLDLSKCSFLYSKFDEALFSDCYFSDNKTYDERQLIENNILVKHKDVLNELRMFEMSFDKRKNYEEAGKFHCKALELQRKMDTNLIKKLLLWLYKMSSEYGENYVRCLVLILITLLIFSITYLFTGINYSGYNIWWLDGSKPKLFTDWGSSLLYSLISSSPIRRDSEVIKSIGGWTTGFSILQAIIQTILGTLFIIGIRRKFKR